MEILNNPERSSKDLSKDSCKNWGNIVDVEVIFQDPEGSWGQLFGIFKSFRFRTGMFQDGSGFLKDILRDLSEILNNPDEK